MSSSLVCVCPCVSILPTVGSLLSYALLYIHIFCCIPVVIYCFVSALTENLSLVLLPDTVRDLKEEKAGES